MTRLTFTPGNHSYWLADDQGRKTRAPSVSSLKSTLHQFQGEQWYLKQAAEATVDAWLDLQGMAPTRRAAAILAAAQLRVSGPMEFGTAVHHYCEQSLWGGEPTEVPDEYVSHVQSVADWWTTQGVSLVAAERMVYADSDPEFGLAPMAGRFDLIIKHPTHGTGLLDLKTWTGNSAGTPRLKEWAFQLAAYTAMEWMVQDELDIPMPRCDWSGILHVGPSGARLYLLPDTDRELAAAQVEHARALKALPNPTMTEESA